ncbi:GIY-YIG nuclease family protein [Lichenibacterium ramalinae]|uniref:GIY-YIG nuclease family protein n=1 Tax=Lichenibacterium ramalinae TaxID=2316527 RepID=UPI00100EBAC5|nr:GIY-YIG nuclease family protein [Lichenibacterium ramalinae]
METCTPGWDAKAINSIAEERFGGFLGLFEAEGWPERGRAMMPAVGRRVVQGYGTVQDFITAHSLREAASPLAQVLADPPNVWLTSFYGFTPETWGFLGFTSDGQRKHFIRETRPGAMVVIYGHKSRAPANQQGKVIGIQQVSHRVNYARAFIDPSEWLRKQADLDRAGQWNLAVKATRAWRVIEEAYPSIEAIASETYSLARAKVIGSQGMRLTCAEARRLLDLTLVETSVFGELPVTAATAASGAELFTPSRPGPVSQAIYVCKEAEGPKSLYLLRLFGDESAYLGAPVEGRWIIKVGISASPSSRCLALNSALPAGSYCWKVVRSNQSVGLPLFPRSADAIRAETQVKNYLHSHEKSLGGEFFLAHPRSIYTAWDAAVRSLNI